MIIIESVQHEELNPKLFMGDKLRPEVRDRLMDIANEFTSTISDDLDYKVLDVLLVGSQAGYNYTDFSDIDLHLVVNLSQICRECPEIVQYLFNAEKSRFNNNYDITIKGIDVEVYVEDVRASTRSNGIYSVMKDEWIRVPSKDDIARDTDIDWSTKSDYQEIVNQINNILSDGSTADIQDMINTIYLMRKESLETEDGEYAEGNLMFKELRNQGYIEKLKDRYYEVRSEELTLEGLKVKEN